MAAASSASDRLVLVTGAASQLGVAVTAQLVTFRSTSLDAICKTPPRDEYTCTAEQPFYAETHRRLVCESMLHGAGGGGERGAHNGHGQH
eukprot:COSAG02_NODE_71_length_42019_cov_36.443893_24_plen_90_part_00